MDNGHEHNNIMSLFLIQVIFGHVALYFTLQSFIEPGYLHSLSQLTSYCLKIETVFARFGVLFIF